MTFFTNCLEKCGIFVDALASEKVATAIQWIVDHPAEAEQMGKNGRTAVKERYNWEIEEKKLLSIFHNLICG